ncbi:MAG: hypothetical protein AAFP19_22965 [Bacteroidota bacterium]
MNQNDSRFFLVYEDRNQARLPVYQRLDVTAAYLFSGRQRQVDGELGLSIFNVFNRVNLLDRDFFLLTSGGNPQLGQLDRNMLPLTPNLYFQLKW